MLYSKTQQLLSVIFAVITGVVVASSSAVIMGVYLLGPIIAIMAIIVWALIFRSSWNIAQTTIILVAVAALLLGTLASLGHMDCGNNCVSGVTDMDKTICLIMGVFTTLIMIIPTLWAAFRNNSE